MPVQSFEKMFKDRYELIKGEAQANGISMNRLFAEAGVSVSTKGRWDASPPRTIQLVDKLHDTLDHLKAEERKKAPTKGS